MAPTITARLAEADAYRHLTGRPLVTLSYAQSLDGCIAAHRGQPFAISGKGAQTYTHRLRSQHSAILVGIGTVLADNPRLTVRLVEGEDPQPVILDSRLRFPLTASLLQQGRRPPWIACTPHADPGRQAQLERAGARLLVLPEEVGGRVSLPALLEELACSGLSSLMVEGGARVITSFLASRLVDLVALTVAPFFLAGLPAVEAPASLTAKEIGLEAPVYAEPGKLFPRLKVWDSERLGDDLLIWGQPDWDD